MADETVTLNDGRKLGYLDLGPADGVPVILNHGTPGSRVYGWELEALANDMGLRVLLPDRPGCGTSSPHPGRKLTDWATDVSELADRLSVSRYHVAGVSGGGPYALVCARRIPEKVISATLVCSGVPPDLPQFTDGLAFGNRVAHFLAKHAPILLKYAAKDYAVAVKKSPGRLEKRMRSQLCNADRAILDLHSRDDEPSGLIKELTEAFRQGHEGFYNDLLLVYRPWNFEVHQAHDRAGPPIHLWHGEADTLVPIRAARAFADSIPECNAHFLADKGHQLLEEETIARLIFGHIKSIST